MRASLVIAVVILSVALGSNTQTSGQVSLTEDGGQPETDVQDPDPNLFLYDFNQPPQRRLVQGEILRIEGDYYVLRQSSGEEMSLQVDNDTKMDVVPTLGDKIEAEVTLQGHAEHIRTPKETDQQNRLQVPVMR
jgi:hypothetical protein